MRLTVLFASFAILTAATLIPAAAGADDARALITKVFDRTSFDQMSAELRLVLTSKGGAQRVRHVLLRSKRNARGESRMLMRFTKPADVRGMGFLLIEHDGGEDDRRLYIAALRRVRRISASGSGGNFMSSDFSYYDIGRPKVVDWTYAFAGEKTLGGVKCRSVAGTAATDKVKGDTGYGKVVWHVDPARQMALGADVAMAFDQCLCCVFAHPRRGLVIDVNGDLIDHD